MTGSLIIAFLFSTWAAGYSDNGYIDVSIGIGSTKTDRPEVTLTNPIGVYEAGIMGDRISVFYQHTSGITTIEDGYGMNLVGVKLKIK